MVTLFSHAGHSHETTEAVQGAAAIDTGTLGLIAIAGVVALIAGALTYALVSRKQKKAVKVVEEKTEEQ